MATIDLTDATVIIGGVNVSGFVSGIGFDLDPWQEEVLQSVYDRPNGTPLLRDFQWVSRGYAPPGMYDAIDALIRAGRAARRRRVGRMHAAYGCRRGRGRW